MNPIVKPVDHDQIIYELTDEDRNRIKQARLITGIGALEDDLVFHRMCIMQLVSAVTQQASIRPTKRLLDSLNKRRQAIRDRRLGGPAPDVPFRGRRRRFSHTSAEERAIIKEMDALRYTDSPICVSQAIADAMIGLNDEEELTPRQRSQLKTLIEDILNTCPVQRTVRELKTTTKVEERRLKTSEYMEAERERMKILPPLFGDDLSFAEKLELIRKAAAIFKVTADQAPGTQANPIAVRIEGESNGQSA